MIAMHYVSVASCKLLKIGMRVSQGLALAPLIDEAHHLTRSSLCHDFCGAGSHELHLTR